jgi:hypothetical protein
MGKQLRHTRRQRGGKAVGSMDDIFIEIDDKIVTIETSPSPLKNKERYIDVLSASKELLEEIESQFPQTIIAKSKAKLSFINNFPKNHTLLYDVLIKPVENLTSVIDQLPTSEPVVPETPNVPAPTKKSKKEKHTYTVVIDGVEHTTTNRDLYFLLIAQGKEATIQKNKKSRKSRKHRK